MNDLLGSVLRCFVRPKHIETLQNLQDVQSFPKEKQLRDHYLLIGEGTRRALRSDNITAAQRAIFFSRVRNFYNALVSQILHYLPLKTRILRAARFLDPGQKENIQENDLVYMCKKLNLDGDVDQLKLEWRCFCSKEFKLGDNANIESFWIDRSQDEEGGVQRFPQLSKLAQYAMCLPHGNADTERLMSSLNRILRRDRNRLVDPTLNGLLQVKTFHAVRSITAHSLQINSEMREAVHQANAKYSSQMQKLAQRTRLEQEQRMAEAAARKTMEQAEEINERKRIRVVKKTSLF